MKLITISFAITLAFFCSFLIAPKAHAGVPDMYGYVRVQGTNAPVSNVWVQITNKDGLQRYELTDDNGYYNFVGASELSRDVKDEMEAERIDTDFDGTDDAIRWEDDSGGGAWTCGRDPFRFTGIVPVSLEGTFTVVGGYKNGSNCEVCINNGDPDYQVATIYFQSAGPKPPTPTPTSLPPPTGCPTVSTNITPSDDIQADSAQPDTNLNGFELEVTSDPIDTNITFMKFNLPPFGGRLITSARLRLYSNNNTDASRSASTPFTIKQVNTNTWNENTLIYNNMPSLGSVIASSSGGLQNTWVEVDLTSFVNTNKGNIVSLAIDTGDPTSSGMHINSKEDTANRPELVVDTTCIIIPTVTPTPKPNTYNISGTIFIDSNQNGVFDAAERPYSRAVVRLSGAASQSTTSGLNGVYTFYNLLPGSYQVQLSAVSGYTITTTNPVSITVTNSAVGSANFGVTGIHAIEGSVFNDVNKNRRKDSGEVNVSPITIVSSGGAAAISNGEYAIQKLPPGTYTVSYTSLPAGYVSVYPTNGPPPSFTVTVGPTTCAVDGTTGASCKQTGSIVELNFAITNSIPWIQGVGTDMRFDGGYNNIIPPSPSCGVGSNAIANGSSGIPGVVYTGSTSPVFGSGQASSRGWVVGGATYPEMYRKTSGIVPSSYNAILSRIRQSGATIRDITTLSGCTLANCTLPNNLQAQTESVYQANGNLTLNGYSFPNSRNFIFLVNGSLTIRGNIGVPVGSSVIFSTSQDIIIPSTVGYAPSCNAGNNTLEGIYSADRNIIVQGGSNCATGTTDQLLRIEGTVIVNAGLGGGTFQNTRDLCGSNLQYPTVTFVERPDFILNASDVIKTKNFLYREEAP